MRSVFGEGERPRAPSRAKTPAVQRRHGNPETMAARAEKLWARTFPIGAQLPHPIQSWLNTKEAIPLWPQDSGPLPRAVRYAESTTGLTFIVLGLSKIDAWLAEGEAASVRAVHYVVLNGEGRPALDRAADKGGLPKRSIGARGPSVCGLLWRGTAPPAGGRLGVCESLADGLKLLGYGVVDACAVRTGQPHTIRGVAGHWGEVVVYAAAAAGRRSGQVLRARLSGRYRVSVRVARGHDPASAPVTPPHVCEFVNDASGYGMSPICLYCGEEREMRGERNDQ